MARLRLQKLVSAKGQLFSLDGLFAILFCALFIFIFNLYTPKELENNIDLIKIQKINDLLITSQYLRIESFEVLEQNYILLFPNTCGYIKINNTKKEINCTNITKIKILSNSIKYINNSNHNVYIEIGVY